MQAKVLQAVLVYAERGRFKAITNVVREFVENVPVSGVFLIDVIPVSVISSTMYKCPIYHTD
jgi:hypothetical protein